MKKDEKQSTKDLLLNSPLKNSGIDLSRSKKGTGRNVLVFDEADIETAQDIKDSLRGRVHSDSAELLREDRKR